ncbi:hypothetical protein AGMMS49991_08160 [Spirochaetia bacterium]|nr:hypothetical protein AGMMS49991_08160 [Spirochaetia bacterium]
MNSSAETGTKYYSDLEIDLLIDDLSEAAKEAIEKAVAEAAKAAALASLEREASLLREAQRWEREYQEARSRGIRNTVITGVVCFLSGLAIGVTGVLVIGGR